MYKNNILENVSGGACKQRPDITHKACNVRLSFVLYPQPLAKLSSPHRRKERIVSIRDSTGYTEQPSLQTNIKINQNLFVTLRCASEQTGPTNHVFTLYSHTSKEH
jgi:hypothetical protein